MALLLGTLLAVQRLSGESEINALKAAGVTFTRIVAPLLAVGIVMSFVTYFLQERVVPYANDQLTEIENAVINHVSAFNRDLTVSAPLAGWRPAGDDRDRLRAELAGASPRHADSVRQSQRSAPSYLCRPRRVHCRQMDASKLERLSLQSRRDDACGAEHSAAGGRNRREANGSDQAHEQRRSREHEPDRRSRTSCAPAS